MDKYIALIAFMSAVTIGASLQAEDEMILDETVQYDVFGDISGWFSTAANDTKNWVVGAGQTIKTTAEDTVQAGKKFASDTCNNLLSSVTDKLITCNNLLGMAGMVGAPKFQQTCVQLMQTSIKGLPAASAEAICKNVESTGLSLCKVGEQELIKVVKAEIKKACTIP